MTSISAPCGIATVTTAVHKAVAVAITVVVAIAVVVAIPRAVSTIIAISITPGTFTLLACMRIISFNVEATHVDGGLSLTGGPHNIDSFRVGEDICAIKVLAGLIGFILIFELDISEAAQFLCEVVSWEVDVNYLAILAKGGAQVVFANTHNVVSAAVQGASAPVVVATRHEREIFDGGEGDGRRGRGKRMGSAKVRKKTGEGEG